MADIYAFVETRLREFLVLWPAYYPKVSRLSFPSLRTLVATILIYLLLVSSRYSLRSLC